MGGGVEPEIRRLWDVRGRCTSPNAGSVLATMATPSALSFPGAQRGLTKQGLGTRHRVRAQATAITLSAGVRNLALAKQKMEEWTPSANSSGDGEPNATCPCQSPARQSQGTFEPGFATWCRSWDTAVSTRLEALVAQSGTPVTASHLRHVCGGETPCPETLHAQTSDDDSPGSRKGQQEHLPGSAPAPPSREHVAFRGDGRLPRGGAFGDSVRALRGRGKGPGRVPSGHRGRGGRPPGAWREVNRGVAFGCGPACPRTSLGGTERAYARGRGRSQGQSGKARARTLGGAGMVVRTWRRCRGVPACVCLCVLERRGGLSERRARRGGVSVTSTTRGGDGGGTRGPQGK